jgi:uncharacterized protein (DUF305 family)
VAVGQVTKSATTRTIQLRGGKAAVPAKQVKPRRPVPAATPNRSVSARAVARVSVLVVLVVVIGVAAYVVGRAGQKEPSLTSALRGVGDHASSVDHNKADVVFTEELVPLDQQSVALAEVAERRGHSREVKDLALKIQFAQQPEFDAMNGWLNDDWGALQLTNLPHVDGMATENQVKSLATMSGAAFDSAFLKMMIRHHTGAIHLATTELEHGKNANALGLATTVQITRRAEINRMTGVLRNMP